MYYRIPLLKDHHTHIALYSSLRKFETLHGVCNEKDAYAVLSRQKKDFSVILGWNSGAYEINLKKTDSLKPIFICNMSLHEFKINQGGRDYLSKKGFGFIVDNIDNQSWVEKNLPSILSMLSEIAGLEQPDIELFFSELAKKGVYYAEEMLVPNSGFLQIIYDSKYRKRTKLWVALEQYELFSGNEQVMIDGIKLFTDGALGSKTAALKRRYLTGEKGMLLYENDEFVARLEQAFSYGKNIAIHAMGELAIEQVIDCLREFSLSGYNNLVRVEHAQFITKKQAKQLKKMGIILSMQPNFNSDSIIYTDRLSLSYLKRNNPFRMLIDEVGFVAGKDLIFGSDGMPHGVEYALKQIFFPVYETQRLTLEEFQAGYCMENFEKGFVGFKVKNNDIFINRIEIL
jgi:predicted amidohydrolase YtcJ